LSPRDVDRNIFRYVRSLADVIGKEKAVAALKYHAKGKVTSVKRASMSIGVVFVYRLFKPQLPIV
jgi:hypothetical protein